MNYEYINMRDVNKLSLVKRIQEKESLGWECTAPVVSECRYKKEYKYEFGSKRSLSKRSFVGVDSVTTYRVKMRRCVGDVAQ